MFSYHINKYHSFNFFFKCTRWIYPYTIFLILASCGRASHDHSSQDRIVTEQHKMLYNEVMDIHDKIMPKMGDMYSLKSHLQKKVSESAGITPEIKDSIQYAIRQLDSAGESMMDWMHQFTPPSDSVRAEEKNIYLEDQMEKIKKVEEKISRAIKSAEARSKDSD